MDDWRQMLAVVMFLAVVSASSGIDVSLRSYGEANGINGSFMSDVKVRQLFEEWMVMHGKSYGTVEEKEKRLGIFRDNAHYIYEHNDPRNNKSYTLGLNHFADLTTAEFRSRYLSTDFNISEVASGFQSQHYEEKSLSNNPDFVDWRSLGVVTPVKDAKRCVRGSWAFSAIATVEAANAIATGDLTPLSEQELIDCDDGNDGCKEGYPHIAYKYILSNNGIDSEENYPYTSGDGQKGICKSDKMTVATISGYRIGSRRSESIMKALVAKRPIAVGLDASSRDFILYDTGVFTESCGTNINHYATIVGYGYENMLAYWLVRNSWSDRWGDDGYIRIKRNVASRDGKCGIAKYFAYPVKSPTSSKSSF